MKGIRRLLLASISVVAVSQVFSVAADTNPQPVDFSHNAINAPAPVAGAEFGVAPDAAPGVAICKTVAAADTNKNTDCNEVRSVGPHNETSIAINPTDPTNIIGGANDYQLSLNPGGHVTEEVRSRAHVTFDGGATWSEYSVFANSAYQGTGDPALAFDAAGHAYYGTLGFRFVGPFTATNPDVLVSNSGDGGKTWKVVRVASGSGLETSVGDLLDKEYVAAWGDGNAIVTYGDFRLGRKGGFISARIFASVTHDSGQSWTTPVVISGSLNEAFVSTPVVAKDGRIFVSFLNTAHSDGRDDYEVVRVDPSTGAAVGDPVKVATTIDGATDYPVAFGRQTYQDSVFRTWAAGNIAADPINKDHLAVVWSDMRNSPQLPTSLYPYSSTTNSDVIVSQSFNGGQTWSDPTAIERTGDQFMPWAVYDSSGKLRIGFFDRQLDSANHLYDYSLATETAATPLTFAVARVSNASSDPTKNDRWFSSTTTLEPAFPYPTSFMGDYSNIAATADGGVVAYWTDMRNTITFAGRTGYGQDAYFAAAS